MSQKRGRREKDHIWIIRWTKTQELGCCSGTWEEADEYARKKNKDHIVKKTESCYLLEPVDEDTSVLRIIDATVGWERDRHYVQLEDEIRILMYKVWTNGTSKKAYKIYYEDYLEGWTKGNRRNLRAREGYLYPGEFGKILAGTIYEDASNVLRFLSMQGRRVGEDRGVEIRYGKNIKKDGISEEVSTGNTVTRIYPKAYNGYKMSGKGYVDSPLLRKYPTVKTITMTFSDVKMAEDAQEGDEEKGIIICNSQDELDQALKMKCENQYSNGLDKPSVTISVDMVLTGNTEEYKQYRKLEEISLGDTVHCRNARLGIVTDARVIELKYNSILKRVESVVIGDYSYNYFNNVSSTVNRVQSAIRSDGTVVAEQVYGAINTLNAFLHAQSTAAKRTDSVAYLIENLDQNSELYGAMEAGTQGLRLAKERKDGEWIWRTAVTAAGIIADLIVTGKIQDRLGKSYWDLDNGKMLLSGIFQQITDNGKKSVDIKNNRINIYSWQKEGDYVGSIGSLAIADDLSEKQRIGVYCDTEDMLVFGYSSKKTAEGDAATVHELMKLSKDGGIECTEIPQINGTKTGRLVFSNGTYVNVKNGYIVGGKTEEGSF